MAIPPGDGAALRTFTDAAPPAAAENVEEVIPVVFTAEGRVLAEADPGSVTLRPGHGATDVPQATFAGRPMAFRYTVATAMIALHDGAAEGHPAGPFGRRSLQKDIVNVFGALRVERDRRA